jgi:two-component system, chemotaxis family, protein-glutamate methylesterase/glutaminase
MNATWKQKNVRQPIRVMVANDSAVIRRLVTESLLDSDGFEVYPAVHGGDAMNQLATSRPHVLVLDTEMPVMNGVQTVRAIRENDPHLPIIMLCLSTEASLRAMIEAIPAGANDCAKFVVRIGHVASAKKHLRDELLPKIRFWADYYFDQLMRSAAAMAAEPLSLDDCHHFALAR